ncbi:MAG: aminotransferase class I/II-fold pyridoxal phosphate-dependent enzyme, partial [Polyangia bacterium]|nr:aminotransferase class I/II-fold pyridoxal phosphate-dependent enzyme [Polyangia bacterium]
MEPSLRTRSIPASATLAISAKAGRLKAAGVDVVDLSVGQPDFPTPEHIVEAARKAMADKAFGYTPTAGTPKLREAVAQNLSAATG